ncbi:MAG: DNA primase [Nocardioides sp.]
MAGRIREKSIAEVRDQARIDEVVGAQVSLRRAGPGSMKGLCPFHDERSPSFNVNPTRGTFHCFGCGEGGDVIAFVMKIDALGFSEAVERLADKFGVTLEREEGEGHTEQRGPGRGKLLEANKIAQRFYAEQLLTPEASVARDYLSERDFDRSVAEDFGLGFAPRDGDALHRYLRGRGFSQDELVTAGLIGVSARGPYDRFRGRLLWPIRESSGDVIGFGARRIFDDDRIEAKYLNTAETPLYKKTHVLYGIERARQEIARSHQAVVVEGYTDVMACHLSGIKTAVASCGTSFTSEHGKVLRRFMGDSSEYPGEIVFTFDGDSAGQKAAVKVFESDDSFVGQTYVVVAPDGQDPCDLRLSAGEEAVRRLIAERQPLYRFVLGQMLARYDLDRADSRVDALREGARLVASIRDRSKVDAFARELAQMIGVDMVEARRAVAAAGQRRVGTQAGPQVSPEVSHGHAAAAAPMPNPRDPRFMLERETMKVALQHPMVIGRTTSELNADHFEHPLYRAMWRIIDANGGVAEGSEDANWVPRLSDAAPDTILASAFSELASEAIPIGRAPDAAYVTELVVRLLDRATQRHSADLHSRLQRMSPDDPGYLDTFRRLNELELRRRDLKARLSTA